MNLRIPFQSSISLIKVPRDNLLDNEDQVEDPDSCDGQLGDEAGPVATPLEHIWAEEAAKHVGDGLDAVEAGVSASRC